MLARWIKVRATRDGHFIQALLTRGTEKNVILHAFDYPFSSSDMVSDLIYVGYLAFMWGTLSLASYLDAHHKPQNARRHSHFN
jgi:hypothetical protein